MMLETHPVSLPDRASTPVLEAFPPVRPWRRYWARVLDVYIGGIFIFTILLIVFPDAVYGPDLVVVFAILICWTPCESLLLATIGTTPGKWLLNITVRSSTDRPLTFGRVLRRSTSVWINGLGLGLPIISFLTLWGAYRALKRDGETEWDRYGRFITTHGRIGVLRWLLILAVVVGLAVVVVVGATTTIN